MTKKLTGKEAIKLLKTAMAVHGADYIYKPPSALGSCVYFDEETEAPSCIVGHVMDDLGITFREVKDKRANSLPARMIPLAQMLDREITPAARRVLQAAQSAQDDGRTWGQAVEEAKMVLAEYKSKR